MPFFTNAIRIISAPYKYNSFMKKVNLVTSLILITKLDKVKNEASCSSLVRSYRSVHVRFSPWLSLGHDRREYNLVRILEEHIICGMARYFYGTTNSLCKCGVGLSGVVI